MTKKKTQKTTSREILKIFETHVGVGVELLSGYNEKLVDFDKNKMVVKIFDGNSVDSIDKFL